MPIDPSIILQAKPVQLADPAELAQRALTIRDLTQRGQMQDLQYQGATRDFQNQQKLADLYRGAIKPDGTLDTEGLTSGMAQAGLGAQIPAIQKAALEAREARVKTSAAELGVQKQKLDLVNGSLASLLTKPDLSHDDVVSAISGWVDQGVLTPEQGAQRVRELPGPDGLRPFLIQRAMESMDASKRLESALPKIEYKDTGGAQTPVDLNPLTNPNPKAVQKTMTPDERAKLAFQQSGGLTDAAKDLMVDRLLAGEKPSNVLGNLGRGQQGANDLRDIQNRMATAARSRGLSGAQITGILQDTAAAGRTMTELGAREGKIAPRVQEALNFAQIAKQASAAVPRGNFLPWTKLSQMADTQINDPALAKLKAATLSLINAYAGAVGGGVMHVHDQEAATKLLSTAQSPEAYNAVVDQLIQETQAALDSPKQVQERIRKERGGGGGATDVPPDIAALLQKHGGS